MLDAAGVPEVGADGVEPPVAGTDDVAAGLDVAVMLPDPRLDPPVGAVAAVMNNATTRRSTAAPTIQTIQS